MTVKKKYNVGDTVWIYGISRGNQKSTQGTVVKSFVIDYEGFNNELHYVIGIPTEIETLLEIRTWHSISQTKDGRVGSIREALSDPDSARKWLSRIGVTLEPNDEEYTGDGHDGMGSISDDDDPSSEEIHAALEKSQKDGEHGPLVTKPTNRKRQYFKKKKV
jgi:hypothetical protein